jgi:hypothetical protein
MAGSGQQALGAAVPSAGCLQLCCEEAALMQDVAARLLALADYCSELGASFAQLQASISSANSKWNAALFFYMATKASYSCSSRSHRVTRSFLWSDSVIGS